MIVQPKVRGFICTTAHPLGCAQHVQEHIDYVRAQGPLTKGPKNVLVIGASTGYGLASRVAVSFGGLKAATIGVFFEKPSDKKRSATAGWYNSVAFEEKAHKEGIYAKSINGDAFSQEIKDQVVEMIKKDWGSVDLIIYSLASPRRVDPKTGEINKSVLKPIGQDYTNKSIDMSTHELETVTLHGANEDEINQTVKVMGGEDWTLWIDALDQAGLLAEGAKTVAYSYMGPQITKSIYRGGTIGRAKDHLEQTAKDLDERFKRMGGRAVISVNKALVTQSSSAIPFIPLYFILLKKVMVAKGVEEDCMAQIDRLFRTALYEDPVVVDQEGMVRMDNLELLDDVQQDVQANWDQLTPENLKDFADLVGYRADFLKLFGFGLNGVNYDEDVEIDLPLPSNLS